MTQLALLNAKDLASGHESLDASWSVFEGLF